MKYAIGYQLPSADEEPFSELCRQYADNISEVYFSWVDMPSGRSKLATRGGYTDWTATARMTEDLRVIKSLGIKLDLLFNANCYGDKAISVELRNQVASIIEYLTDSVGGVDIVTTTSPFIAEQIKKYFPNIEVRASVNMWIGTVKAMNYVSDIFDSFYLQREYNRDFEVISENKEWCDKNGKKLLMLANSGCMAFCPSHSFHDNLVAHESNVGETKNVEDFMPYACWKHLKNRDNWHSILQNTWVRPEDIHNYNGYFETVKLATRMHKSPAMVLNAYVNERFYGNLPDLFEPGFGRAFAPYYIDNKKLPDDFFKVTSNCKHKCDKCDYCKNVFESILVKE